jgi:hypothetical protein
MLRLFRARVSCLLTAILLAASTTTASLDEFLHGGDSHDPACATTAGFGHDASNHRIGAPQAAEDAPQHCVACHLARAPRLGAQSALVAAQTTESFVLRLHDSVDSASSAELSRVPGRSPPSLA